jgi:anti-sigma B factor antagonist
MERLSTIIVKLPEVFGAKAAMKLGRELKSKLADCNPQVILDLSRVKKIDSKGLEALLKCLQEIAKQDGALQFGKISPEAATLLEVTRMDRLFQKFPGFTADAPAFTLSTESIPEEVPAEQVSDTSVQLPVAA